MKTQIAARRCTLFAAFILTIMIFIFDILFYIFFIIL